MNRLSWQRAVERALGASGTAHWMSAGRTGWGDAWSVVIDGARSFVKTATGRHAGMLAAEADGLRALDAARTIRVPEVRASGSEEGTAFLALEWLEMRGSRDDAAAGRALAALHRVLAPAGPGGERFGWHRDNWIGGTPQANDWCDDWCAFFRDRRLAPQLALAERNGFDGALIADGELLLAKLPSLMGGHDPAPSLLHGDLWSGNAAALANGEPVVFDPAVYVGDREADIAMTELFGGFGRDFYAAYFEAAPVDEGYSFRRELYNLYHVLNHLNLFGTGYLAQSERLIGGLLAQAKS